MPKINEHFYSIQGEGKSLGIPSYFIRFSTCPFKCSLCDSKHAWEDIGNDLCDFTDRLEIPENCNNVVITGGEPSTFFNDVDFKKLLLKIGNRNIEIETTGVPKLEDIKNNNIYNNIEKFNTYFLNNIPQYIVSPKLNSGNYPWMEDKITTEDIFNFYRIFRPIEEMIYKIVYIKTEHWIIKEFINACIPTWFRSKVYIMPVTIPTEGWNNLSKQLYNQSCKETIEFCKEYGLRYTPRVHVDVYGLIRGV